MPDTTSPDTSTSPSTFDADAYGPPAGCVDALASWRRVIAQLQALELSQALDAESAVVDG